MCCGMGWDRGAARIPPKNVLINLASTNSLLIQESEMHRILSLKWEQSVGHTSKALMDLEYRIAEKTAAAERLEIRVMDKDRTLKAMQSTNAVLENYLVQLEARLALYRPPRGGGGELPVKGGS